MKLLFKVGLLMVALVLLGGCAVSNPKHEMSSAAQPVGGKHQPVLVVAPIGPVQNVIKCLQAHGSFSGKMIALGPWVDNTGKANFSAQGATGSFLPGAGTTAFALAPLMSLGARTQDLTDLQMETNFRGLLPSQVQQYAAQKAAANVANFFVDGKWMTLDTSDKGHADTQADGAGPFFSNNDATVVAMLNIKIPGTQEVIATSMLRRTVYSTELGISFGRYIGGVLTTGEAAVANQQRLQLESSEYLVRLGLVDALTQRPEGKVCRPMVDAILAPPISEAPKVVLASAK